MLCFTARWRTGSFSKRATSYTLVSSCVVQDLEVETQPESTFLDAAAQVQAARRVDGHAAARRPFHGDDVPGAPDGSDLLI